MLHNEFGLLAFFRQALFIFQSAIFDKKVFFSISDFVTENVSTTKKRQQQFFRISSKEIDEYTFSNAF